MGADETQVIMQIIRDASELMGCPIFRSFHHVYRSSILRVVGVAAMSLRGAATRIFRRPIEIVNFQTLTFPGSLFIYPFMAAPQEGKADDDTWRSAAPRRGPVGLLQWS